MAAHILTALKQLREDEFGMNLARQMRAALDLSTWTEDLDLEEWGDLNDITNARLATPELTPRVQTRWTATLDSLHEKYTDVWRELGQPATREEWHRAKYGD